MLRIAEPVCDLTTLAVTSTKGIYHMDHGITIGKPGDFTYINLTKLFYRKEQALAEF